MISGTWTRLLWYRLCGPLSIQQSAVCSTTSSTWRNGARGGTGQIRQAAGMRVFLLLGGLLKVDQFVTGSALLLHCFRGRNSSRMIQNVFLLSFERGTVFMWEPKALSTTMLRRMMIATMLCFVFGGLLSQLQCCEGSHLSRHLSVDMPSLRATPPEKKKKQKEARLGGQNCFSPSTWGLNRSLTTFGLAT